MSAARAATSILLAVLLTAPGVRADDEQTVAGQFFQAGLAAYARHDFKAAARAFEEANRHVPRAESMFNAGLAWEAGGEGTRAADAYAASLASGELRGDDAAKARRQLDGLERELGVLRIVAPSGAKASVAHLNGATIPLSVHVHPGDYDVKVERVDGARGSAHVQVSAGVTVRVAVELPPLATAPGESTQTPNGDAVRTWGWIALGAAGVVAVASGVIGYEGLQARDAFEQSGETSAHAHDEAATYRTLANVGWVLTGAMAVTGVVLFVLPTSAAKAQSPNGVVVMPGGAGFWVRF
jgi:hypothetical protein